MKNMEKYREILEAWCRMESWDEMADKEGLFTREIPGEMIEVKSKQYFDDIERRIKFCEKLAKDNKEKLVYYTLAELCYRRDPNKSLENLYRLKARYYCKKALQHDIKDPRAWALMADLYSWVALIFGVKDLEDGLKGHIEKKLDVYAAKPSSKGEISEKQRMAIKRIERAIFCIKKAISLDPDEPAYRNHLNNFYDMRNQEYKLPEETRIAKKGDGHEHGI